MVYYYATIFLFVCKKQKRFFYVYIYELLIINCLLMYYD